MYIYIITNLINEKYYIGKTTNPNLHWYLSNKRWAAKHGNPGNMPIVDAISKYGLDNFAIEILATANNDEELCSLEKLWIGLLNSRNSDCGYNICMGGEGRVGIPCTEDHKRKIGLANKGRKPKGYIRTEKHRQQIRERMKGNKNGKGRGFGHFVSEEEKEKHRQNALKQWKNNPPRQRVSIF